jgi:ribose/xylose/arabinose/galactoside ABC-type transport system permease subunit/ABC-type sugar transport system substrate-binding protein
MPGWRKSRSAERNGESDSKSVAGRLLDAVLATLLPCNRLLNADRCLPPADRQAMPPSRRQFRMREVTILVSVLLAIAIFGALNPRFLRVEAALAILEGASTDGLMVIGMTIVIVCGAFDMSVGSAMSLCGMIAALAMKQGSPVWLAVAAALVTGVVIGWTNGAIVTRMKINPFITTLGTMSILRGIVLVVTRSSPPTGFPESFLKIAWGTLFGIPFPVLLFAVAMLGGDLLLRHLAYLRQVYFVGSNEEAARLTGIRTAQVKTFAFVLTGLLAAVAGVIITSRANAVDPAAGTGAELRVIAAVIVGGASLSGGRGTILGSFLGLMLMQIITTGLVFIDVAPEAQLIAVGLVLILAAVIDRSGSSGLARRLLSLLVTSRSKKVERAINVALAVALVAALAVRFGNHSSWTEGSSQAQSGKQRFVMISAATGMPYWIDAKLGLEDKANELGVKANFTGPPTVDVNQQIDAINRAVAQGMDGIIVVPMADAVTPAIDKAIDAGIPVVCADADAPSSRRFCFVGTGNYNAGYEGGQRLGKLLGGRGKVALITIPGTDHLTRRVNGYRDALANYPGIEIVRVGNDQGSINEAQKECRAILQAVPDLAGFGCVDAGGGQGAAVAVKQAGKIGTIKIVAMDRDEATLQFIEEGIIDASVCQRSYMMSYLALQMLYDLRNGRIKFVNDWEKVGVNPLPTNVDTGNFVVTKENVRHFRRP